MLWGKKSKSKQLPELPPLPVSRSTVPAEEVMEEPEESNMPVFPESTTEMTTEEEESELSEPPATLKSFKAVEMESEERPAKSGDIYIKVDKFVSARKALENAQQKVNEMQELLKVIRETKMREEQELAYWEKEMTSAKAQVQQVTENIFGKVE